MTSTKTKQNNVLMHFFEVPLECAQDKTFVEAKRWRGMILTTFRFSHSTNLPTVKRHLKHR